MQSTHTHTHSIYDRLNYYNNFICKSNFKNNGHDDDDDDDVFIKFP